MAIPIPRLVRCLVATAILLFANVPHARAAALQVNDAEAKKAATKKPPPEYPAMARQMNLIGRVDLEVNIDAEGSVGVVSVKFGNPVLAAAVVRAVKKWSFTPFTEDGKPTNALAAMSFEFRR